jgi:hypothetical protein
MCWANGKLPEHKKANDLNDTLKESMKMLVSVRTMCIPVIKLILNTPPLCSGSSVATGSELRPCSGIKAWLSMSGRR